MGKDFKHAEARDDRLKERDEQLTEKQKQVDKMLKQSQKFRDQQEVQKLNAWKEAQHQHKAWLEDLRNKREDAGESAREAKADKDRAHGEVYFDPDLIMLDIELVILEDCRLLFFLSTLV